MVSSIKRFITHLYMPILVLGIIACAAAYLPSHDFFMDQSCLSLMLFFPFASWLTGQPLCFWLWQYRTGIVEPQAIGEILRFGWPASVTYQLVFFLLMFFLDQKLFGKEKIRDSLRVIIAELSIFIIITYAMGFIGFVLAFMTSGQRLG